MILNSLGPREEIIPLPQGGVYLYIFVAYVKGENRVSKIFELPQFCYFVHTLKYILPNRNKVIFPSARVWV